MIKQNAVILLGLIFLSIPDYAISGIFKCKNANDGISFQEHPCSTHDSEVKLHSSITLAARTSPTKLYSAIPSISTIKPDCTRKQPSNIKLCYCENKRYYMTGNGKSGLVYNSSLQYSMEQLPIQWNKYNEMLKNYKKTSKDKKSDLYKRLDFKACEILIVQKRISSQFETYRSHFAKQEKQKIGTEEEQRRRKLHLQKIDTMAKNIGM